MAESMDLLLVNDRVVTLGGRVVPDRAKGSGGKAACGPIDFNRIEQCIDRSSIPVRSALQARSAPVDESWELIVKYFRSRQLSSEADCRISSRPDPLSVRIDLLDRLPGNPSEVLPAMRYLFNVPARIGPRPMSITGELSPLREITECMLGGRNLGASGPRTHT